MTDDAEAQLERSYEARIADAEAERRAGALKQLAGLAILLALVGINALCFEAVGRSYFTWYLDNGALIALVFGVVSVAVELDGHPQLIAAGPIRFVLGIVSVLLELTTSFWAMFGHGHGDRAFDTVLASAGSPTGTRRSGSRTGWRPAR